MKEADSSGSIYPQLDGKNGKIELTGASIKITTYKLKFMAGLRGGLDKSKIKEVYQLDIPTWEDSLKEELKYLI